MGSYLVQNQSIDVNDTTDSIEFGVGGWTRLSVQMTDPAATISTAVVELQISLDGGTWTSYATPIVFDSGSAWVYDVDVSGAIAARLTTTIALGSSGDVQFTVYGYDDVCCEDGIGELLSDVGERYWSGSWSGEELIQWLGEWEGTPVSNTYFVSNAGDWA